MIGHLKEFRCVIDAKRHFQSFDYVHARWHNDKESLGPGLRAFCGFYNRKCRHLCICSHTELHNDIYVQEIKSVCLLEILVLSLLTQCACILVPLSKKL